LIAYDATEQDNLSAKKRPGTGPAVPVLGSHYAIDEEIVLFI